MSVLDRINYPEDLRKLSIKELNQLAGEIREMMISVVSDKGGHLASNLGVVELTIALHYVFNAPTDKILFDVSHQCYTHKILTGRKKLFPTLRTYGGISGFTKIDESEYDAFDAGHANTAISASLGFAVGRDLKGEDYNVIAVVGDGALTGGMAFEGLNNAGYLKKKLIIVLNENEMSISPNVGAFSGYLKRIIEAQSYVNLAKDVEGILKSIPGVGEKIFNKTRQLVNAFKEVVVPGKVFEELGFRYFGRIDGHNIKSLIDTFNEVKKENGPVIVHVLTKKGKGYKPAEMEPDRWHGTSSFEISTGKSLKKSKLPTYTKVFSKTLVKLAKKDDKIVAITASMLDGTGLSEFNREFPDRCFDVGIAEQHAVTFAAGLARSGFKPVVAIYSTFLQRAYDQIFHDVCLMNLPVVFCLDRAGIVGDDGPTHHGLYDLTYLRALPNMTVMAPSDDLELEQMLYTALRMESPVAIRYPRGQVEVANRLSGESVSEIPVGRAKLVKEGKDNVVIVAIGNMVYPSVRAAKILEKKGISATVVNARFVKPIDREILNLVLPYKYLITVEENTLCGGFGSAVMELISDEKIKVKGVLRIGIPDAIVPHGSQEILRGIYKLDAVGISNQTLKFLEDVGWERGKESTNYFLKEDFHQQEKRRKD